MFILKSEVSFCHLFHMIPPTQTACGRSSSGQDNAAVSRVSSCFFRNRHDIVIFSLFKMLACSCWVVEMCDLYYALNTKDWSILNMFFNLPYQLKSYRPIFYCI
jgi:hypothetical protein